MTTALIVIVVELATLGERPVDEDGVVQRNPSAIFYNAGRAATLGVFDKSIDRPDSTAQLAPISWQPN